MGLVVKEPTIAVDRPFPVIEIMSANDGRRKLLHQVEVVFLGETQRNGRLEVILIVMRV